MKFFFFTLALVVTFVAIAANGADEAQPTAPAQTETGTTSTTTTTIQNQPKVVRKVRVLKRIPSDLSSTESSTSPTPSTTSDSTPVEQQQQQPPSSVNNVAVNPQIKFDVTPVNIKSDNEKISRVPYRPRRGSGSTPSAESTESAEEPLIKGDNKPETVQPKDEESKTEEKDDKNEQSDEAESKMQVTSSNDTNGMVPIETVRQMLLDQQEQYKHQTEMLHRMLSAQNNQTQSIQPQAAQEVPLKVDISTMENNSNNRLMAEMNGSGNLQGHQMINSNNQKHEVISGVGNVERKIIENYGNQNETIVRNYANTEQEKQQQNLPPQSNDNITNQLKRPIRKVVLKRPLEHMFDSDLYLLSANVDEIVYEEQQDKRDVNNSNQKTKPMPYESSPLVVINGLGQLPTQTPEPLSSLLSLAMFPGRPVAPSIDINRSVPVSYFAQNQLPLGTPVPHNVTPQHLIPMNVPMSTTISPPMAMPMSPIMQLYPINQMMPMQPNWQMPMQPMIPMPIQPMMPMPMSPMMPVPMSMMPPMYPMTPPYYNHAKRLMNKRLAKEHQKKESKKLKKPKYDKKSEAQLEPEEKETIEVEVIKPEPEPEPEPELEKKKDNVRYVERKRFVPIDDDDDSEVDGENIVEFDEHEEPKEITLEVVDDHELSKPNQIVVATSEQSPKEEKQESQAATKPLELVRDSPDSTAPKIITETVPQLLTMQSKSSSNSNTKPKSRLKSRPKRKQEKANANVINLPKEEKAKKKRKFKTIIEKIPVPIDDKTKSA